jgi:hypothetical protein
MKKERAKKIRATKRKMEQVTRNTLVFRDIFLIPPQN